MSNDDDIRDRWALAIAERDAAETQLAHMRTAFDKAVADGEIVVTFLHAGATRDSAETELGRLRAVADAAHTLVEALDANPIGEYGDAVCEAIDVLDAKLKATKEGT